MCSQRADRAEVDDIALQLRGHRVFEIGGDLHVLAAADGAEVGGAGDFRGEADAARALDAAVHRRLDERADILVLDRALVLGEARRVDAVGHRLVLQVALAALVADRAIQRMVDEQELHHAFARLLHHRRLGEHRRRLAVRAGAAVAHAPGAGRDGLGRALHLDEAHAAIAGDRQPLVEAEARNFRARRLARLQQRVLRGDVDLRAVDDELGHRMFLAPLIRQQRRADRRCLRCAGSPHNRSMRFSISWPEMPDQALNRPRRRVAQRADRVAFDLRGDFEQHVDLALLGAALGHAVHHAPHPARALAAGRALAAALVLVEIRDARDGADRCRSTCPSRSRPPCRGPTCRFAQRVEIHRRVDDLRRAGTQRHRRAAGNDGQQIVPAAAHAAAMRVDQFAEGKPIASSTLHGLFTWPEMQNSLVPALFLAPKPENHAAPRRRMVGATAIDSTLFTVVGQP